MPRIGVLLPTFDPFRRGEQMPVTRFAARAEELGFDGVWVGDHLWCPSPVLDSVTSLAACAAVTERIQLGFSVMLLGMRPAAWTAKQLATLQHLSNQRVQLGVGVGGEFPQEYEAAGVPLRGRGARLDRALEALPGLMDGSSVGLEPAAPMPRLLVGGRSDASMRRAVAHADAWMPMWVSPETLARRAASLGELAEAAGRECPRLALVMLVHVCSDGQRDRGHADADGHLRGQYGMTLDRIERWTGLGEASQIAEYVTRYVDVGVEDFVLMPIGLDQLGQLEGLADVLEQLPERGDAYHRSPQRSSISQ